MPLGREALHQHIFDQALARLQVAEQNVELEHTNEILHRRLGHLRWRSFSRIRNMAHLR
jgi:hypothetical protein